MINYQIYRIKSLQGNILDGDMSGLIGDDFGEFTINFNIMSDSVYKANDYGKYDPTE